MKHPILVVSCLLAIAAAWLDFERHSDGQERSRERIERHGLDERFPELGSEVGRRYDPIDADLRVALALLNSELDRSWLADLDDERAQEELERGPARLAEAAEIARASWPRRAASWQAALVLGGATYLQLYRGRDPRLISEAELWERPLRAAHRLAPAEPGPIRFLAAAQLGNWSSLTDEQRLSTTELLERAFRDRTTYRLLVADWLRVAPSRARALALIPEQPWAWEVLQRIFTSQGDWELLVGARERWYETLGTDLDRRLEEIRDQVRGGERRRARSQLLNLLRGLPLSLDFAPRLEGLLELLPPGPVGSESAAVFGRWLEWAFELCLVSGCPFEPRTTARLARLTGDLPPHQRALGLLIAGDLPRAELLERRFGQAGGDEWSAYLLLKAEHLARAGEADPARATLDLLPSSWRDRPRYWLARRSAAEAGDDAAAEREATTRLAELGRSSWDAAAWSPAEGRELTLDLLPTSAAGGLALSVEATSGRGAVIEIFFDGRLIAIRRIARARTTFDLELPVSADPHRLSVRVHAGDRVRTSATRLL